MRVTQKLGLLVAAPLTAVVGFAALAVVTTGGAAVRADELRRLVVTSAAAGELVHRLQLERAGAVGTLSGGSVGPEAYAELVGATDLAAQQYRQARADLPELPPAAAGLVGRIDGQLAQLAGLRDEVSSGEGRASATAFRYRIVIADLIGLRESVAQAGGASAEVADRLRAAAALTQAGEAVGLQQTAVLRVAGYGPLSQAALQEITAARAANIEALQTFDGLATPGWRVALERAATGEEALLAQELEDRVSRTPPGGRLAVDAEQWTAAMSGRLQRQRQVEQAVDADILAEVTALRDAKRWQAGLQIGAVLLAVAGAVALAVVLGRPVVRGLRRLRQAALEVATRQLPEAVAALEQQEELGGLTPEQFAAQAPPPVPVHGSDELAEVAAAFNIVHRATLRTAAGQTMLRVRIGEMFVNVARRAQGLHGRLTAALDDLERDETDTRRLRKLFQADVLVTLWGRANLSLLVLGGDASARVPPEGDEPLAEVLRAAGSQVADYERVEVRVVDDGLAIRAAVVDDVVLLLAELLDNACRFSPPDTAVVVNGRWLEDRVVVSVIDQGVGFSRPERREEFNRRLSTRVPLDVQAMRSMGLTVVSRLVERHGIRVELRAGQPRGTIAEVSLPFALLSAAAPRGRTTATGHARPGQAAVAPARSASPPRPQYAEVGRGLDMSWPPGATSRAEGRQVAAIGAAQPALPGQGTQELPLPIYEQVRRSMWFTPPDGETVEMAAVGSGGARAGADTWQTPADAGWQAAANAASPQPAGLTGSGLPVRRPGAQLVPGGVDQPHPATPVATLAGPAAATGSGRLPDPARVSAAAAAFSRGLSTGRGQTNVVRSHTSDGTEPDDR